MNHALLFEARSTIIRARHLLKSVMAMERYGSAFPVPKYPTGYAPNGLRTYSNNLRTLIGECRFYIQYEALTQLLGTDTSNLGESISYLTFADYGQYGNDWKLTLADEEEVRIARARLRLQALPELFWRNTAIEAERLEWAATYYELCYRGLLEQEEEQEA